MSSYTENNDRISEMQANLELLGELPQFNKLSSKQLKLLALLAERVTYDEGDTLFEEGDDFRCTFIVIQGKLSLKKRSGTAFEHVNHFGEKQVLGSLALLAPMPALFSLKAECRTTVLTIRRDHFLKLLDQFPESAKILVQSILRQLHQWERRNLTRAGSCCLKQTGVTAL